jgi:2-methylisocitrate lyase-like PEP mutase family enzyme
MGYTVVFFIYRKESEVTNKVDFFRELHQDGMLLLPNAWDVVSAKIYQSLGFKAIATTSGGIAFAQGYGDGELIPWVDQLKSIKSIVDKVDLPVSADIEAGYADNLTVLEEHINQLIDIGVVGINIEDSKKDGSKELKSVEEQCQIISKIRSVSTNRHYPLFINARTDAVLLNVKNALDETIKCGLTFKEAGADLFFPLGLNKIEDIKRVIEQTGMKLNVHGLPNAYDIKKFRETGASRYTFGYMGVFYTADMLRTAVSKMLSEDDASVLFSFDPEITDIISS